MLNIPSRVIFTIKKIEIITKFLPFYLTFESTDPIVLCISHNLIKKLIFFTKEP